MDMSKGEKLVLVVNQCYSMLIIPAVRIKQFCQNMRNPFKIYIRKIYSSAVA